MDRLYLCGRDGPPPPPPPTWPGPNGLDSDRNRRWTHRFVTIERERERERELQHHSFRVIRETWPSKRCGPYNRVLLDDRWWAIGFRTGFHRNGPNFTGFLFFCYWVSNRRTEAAAISTSKERLVFIFLRFFNELFDRTASFMVVKGFESILLNG